LTMICGVTACAPTHELLARTGSVGTRFIRKGKVTLHRGEPCTSQIMFDFHPVESKSIIWLAAGAHDSSKLTEAAQSRGRVQITGIWKRGRQSECAYVDVSKVIVERSWWDSLFKP